MRTSNFLLVTGFFFCLLFIQGYCQPKPDSCKLDDKYEMEGCKFKKKWYSKNFEFDCYCPGCSHIKLKGKCDKRISMWTISGSFLTTECLECQKSRCWSNYEPQGLTCIKELNPRSNHLGQAKFNCSCLDTCFPISLKCAANSKGYYWQENINCHDFNDISINGFDNVLFSYNAKINASKFNVGCKEGFRMANDVSEVNGYCFNNKFHTPSKIKCEPIKCGQVPEILNCDNEEENSDDTFGSVRVCSCKSNCMSVNIHCSLNGQWVITNETICNEFQDKELEQLDNNILVSHKNETFQYKCKDESLRLIGPSKQNNRDVCRNGSLIFDEDIRCIKECKKFPSELKCDRSDDNPFDQINCTCRHNCKSVTIQCDTDEGNWQFQNMSCEGQIESEYFGENITVNLIGNVYHISCIDNNLSLTGKQDKIKCNDGILQHHSQIFCSDTKYTTEIFTTTTASTTTIIPTTTTTENTIDFLPPIDKLKAVVDSNGETFNFTVECNENTTDCYNYTAIIQLNDNKILYGYGDNETVAINNAAKLALEYMNVTNNNSGNKGDEKNHHHTIIILTCILFSVSLITIVIIITIFKKRKTLLSNINNTFYSSHKDDDGTL